MSTTTYFGSTEVQAARTLVGGTALGDTRNELLKQILVATANRTGGSGGGTWGSITGILSAQTDLQAALDAKLSLAGGAMTGNLTTKAAGLLIPGSVSGTVTVQAPPVAGTPTITFPSVTSTLATLGANQFTAAQIISTGSDVATNLQILNAAGTQPRVQAGTLATATVYGAIYLGNVTPSATNFTLIGDGSTSTYLNSGTGSTIYFSHSGSDGMSLNVTTGLALLKATYSLSWFSDVFLYRKAAATLQMGLDAAGVTNQMFTAASRITSDGVGANLTIAGGNGRGGAGGSLILATYDTQGAATIGVLQSRLVIDTAGAVSFPVTTAVTTESVTSDRTWPVTINGVTYKVCLKA